MFYVYVCVSSVILFILLRNSSLTFTAIVLFVRYPLKMDDIIVFIRVQGALLFFYNISVYIRTGNYIVEQFNLHFVCTNLWYNILTIHVI